MCSISHYLSDLELLEIGERGISVMLSPFKGLVNYGPWTKSSLLPVFVNKVYQNSSWLFVNVLSIVDFSMHSRIESLQQRSNGPQTLQYSLFGCLALYRRSLPIEENSCFSERKQTKKPLTSIIIFFSYTTFYSETSSIKQLKREKKNWAKRWWTRNI